MNDHVGDDVLQPPDHPPRFLSLNQVHQLYSHGYVNIDLPSALAARFDALRTATDAFFALPLDDKLPFRPGHARGPPCSPATTERGYTHLPEEKEFLTLRRSLSYLPPGLYPVAAPLWHDAAHLLRRILADLAVYLHLAPTAFDPVIHDSLEPGAVSDPASASALSLRQDPPTLLRMFRYAPGGGGAEPHQDLGMLTLCVCWGRGLQVRPNPAGYIYDPAISGWTAPLSEGDTAAWLDAPRITVMTGNTLRVLTNGLMPAAQHRVVVPRMTGISDAEGTDIAVSADGARRSIVFALRATVIGEIDTRPFTASGAGYALPLPVNAREGDTTALTTKVNARELYDAIRRRRVNINAGKETRETMRSIYRRAGNNGSDSTTASTETKSIGEKRASKEPIGVA